MVGGEGAGVEFFEGVAVGLTIFDDALDGGDGVTLDVVLEDDGRVGAERVDDVPVDAICGGGFAGVAGVGVPVEVGETALGDFLG